MKNSLSIALLVGTTFLFTGCTSTKPEKTSLEIQAIQSKSFEAKRSVAFASTLSVFQDLGYIIQSADKDTGFITARSATKNSTDFWAAMSGLSKNTKTNATAFIEELKPGLTKVRLNFVVSNSSSSAYGQNTANDNVIDDPKVYETAFNKIGDAIFIRTSS
jgi:16S rRNA C1402 (ribose-2'-O) methylase RsmI